MGGDGAAPEDGADRHTARAETSAGPYQLSYVRSGERGRQRVIFVHGTPGSANTWADFLADGHHSMELLSVDRPGFGLTLPTRDQTSLAVQAEVLEPLLRPSESGHRPILVGHSLGGPIVAKAAALYPERVGGIVIVAGSLDPSLEKIHPVQYVGAVWPFSWMIGRTLRNSNRELLDLKDELEILAGQLGEIQLPISILHGTEDRLVPYANVPFMQQAFRANPDVELVRLDGMNHFLPWNARPVIWSAIERMAARLVASAAAP